MCHDAPPQPESSALSPSPARVRGTIAAAVAQPDDLRQLRAFHKVMADVNRLRIVRRLADGEATVAELIAHVGLSPAARVVAPRPAPRRRRRRDAAPGPRDRLPPPPGGLRRVRRARARDPRAWRG